MYIQIALLPRSSCVLSEYNQAKGLAYCIILDACCLSAFWVSLKHPDQLSVPHLSFLSIAITGTSWKSLVQLVCSLSILLEFI